MWFKLCHFVESCWLKNHLVCLHFKYRKAMTKNGQATLDNILFILNGNTGS